MISAAIMSYAAALPSPSVVAVMLACMTCDAPKLADDFARLESGNLRGTCEECRNAARRQGRAEPERRAADRRRAKAWREANPDRVREHALKSHYGLTVAEFDAMLATQDGGCAICGAISGRGNGSGLVLHVDHDHTTGAVRGLLCANCNKALGCFRDDPKLMIKAADYLNRTRKDG